MRREKSEMCIVDMQLNQTRQDLDNSSKLDLIKYTN